MDSLTFMLLYLEYRVEILTLQLELIRHRNQYPDATEGALKEAKRALERARAFAEL